jgi:hypothetical protein
MEEKSLGGDCVGGNRHSSHSDLQVSPHEWYVISLLFAISVD